MKMTVFWDVVPCSLVETGRRFKGKFIRNYTAQHPRRQPSSQYVSQKLLSMNIYISANFRSYISWSYL
jgi:hypothetical protein